MQILRVMNSSLYFLTDDELKLESFPVVIETDNKALFSQVYPLKQKSVQILLNIATGIEPIRKIILFGSAITDRCHWNSDLDIAVQTDCTNKEEYYNAIRSLYEVEGGIDILDIEEIKGSRLYDDVCKGVIIYERLY